MKFLIGSLVLSSLLFGGECTQVEHSKSEKIFADSRNEHNLEKKIELISKAKKICDIAQIEIEMERLRLNHLIEKNQFDKLEIRLHNLISLVDEKDNLGYAFRFNTKRQITKMFKIFYEKQKRMMGKKSIFGVKVKNIDSKLALFKKMFRGEDLKSLGSIGGLYKSDLNFNKDKSKIRNVAEAEALKKKIREVISSTPKALFSITGYASSEGTARYNKALSERRARSVASFVDINQKNVKVFSKGESFLICNDGLIPEYDENSEYRCINGEDREASRRVIVRRIR